MIVNPNSPVVGLVAALAQVVLTSFYCSLTVGHKPINPTIKGQRKHERINQSLSNPHQLKTHKYFFQCRNYTLCRINDAKWDKTLSTKWEPSSIQMKGKNLYRSS